MKAVVHHEYGSPDKVLRLADVEKPTLNNDEVLVRVRAASINAGDWRGVKADPFIIRIGGGLRKPKDPGVGVDGSGVVEAAGSDVKDLEVGDAVFGIRSGFVAEYVAGKQFVEKPANISFEQAAAVGSAGVTAVQAVRNHGNVQAGQKVLVNGAGGGVGTFVVQVARAFGAEVTAATSTDKLDVVRSLGAEHVIDYTRDDFTRNGQRYDVVFDLGSNRSIKDLRSVLAPGGKVVLVGAGKGRFGPLRRLVGAVVRTKLLRQPLAWFIASGPFNENLEVLRGLIENGKVTPIVERTFPISETGEAMRYVESEKARGKIVITMDAA